MPNPTPSIREKFNDSFEKYKSVCVRTPERDREWAFLEGMRVASEIAGNSSIEIEHYCLDCEKEEVVGTVTDEVKEKILSAIKEFTDDHPK